MITKCPYCDFKREAPLSLDIMRVALEPDLPIEDFLLWMRRLVEQSGTKDYSGVKVHIGRMHKGFDKWPAYEFSKEEKKVIKEMEVTHE